MRIVSHRMYDFLAKTRSTAQRNEHRFNLLESTSQKISIAPSQRRVVRDARVMSQVESVGCSCIYSDSSRSQTIELNVVNQEATVVQVVLDDMDRAAIRTTREVRASEYARNAEIEGKKAALTLDY